MTLNPGGFTDGGYDGKYLFSGLGRVVVTWF